VISKKNIKRIFAFVLALFLLNGVSVGAESGRFSSLIESFPKGKIDWGGGFFYGVGIGYPHMNDGSKAKALKVAQASALSSILQVASKLRVDDQNRLSDLEEKKVIIQIKGLIYYEPYERKFFKSGAHPFYQVTYRAPMKGVKGLTRKLLPNLRSRPVSSLEDIPGEKTIDDREESPPWLVLDARELKHQDAVQPAIFPKIVTEDGESVYDLNTPEEGSLVKNGMIRYVVSDKNQDELGLFHGNGILTGLRALFSPRTALAEERRRRKRRGKYIIKNVRQAQGLMKTNLVISEGDAKDIREADASSQILKKCRVMVIVSSPIGGIEGHLLEHLAFFR